MMKTFLTRTLWGEILLAGVFSCLFALSALAQNASSTSQVGPGDAAATVSPTQRIGPASTNTKQHQILSGALSSQTRQTLQEAMNSASTTDTAHPAPPAK